jgi:hypothetical protein
MKKGIKISLISVVVLGVAFAAYSFLSKESSDTDVGLVSGFTAQPVSSLGDQNPVSGVEIGQEFISMLLSLRSLDLDTTLFQDPSFLSLIDKTITFQDPGGNGRPNPFAPIGSDSIVPTESSEGQNDNPINSIGDPQDGSDVDA